MRRMQPVSLGGIEFDALISYGRNLESDIPEYPVEDGYSVEDTIILHPKTIEVAAFLTDSPVTFHSADAGPGRVERIARQLEKLYEQRRLVTFITPHGVYRDMGIQNLSLPYSVETKTSMQVTFTLKQVDKVGAKTTNIPAAYGKSGETGAYAGTVQATPATVASGGSIAAAEAEKEDSKTLFKGITDGAGDLLGRLFGGGTP